MAGLTTITLSLVLPTVPKMYQASATTSESSSEQKQEFNIQKFDSNGKFLYGWGTRGSGNDQFYHAHGIAIDSSGNVYISDQGNYRSKKSHSDAIPHISKFTSDGKFITKWGSDGTGDGQFTQVESMAVDPSGNVYVAELGNSRISKFTSDGKFIKSWGSEGSGDGSLEMPWGVAFDPSGNLLVTDKGKNMAFKFSPDGKFIKIMVPTGPGDGELQHPHGIAFDSSGNFYIPDQVHANIQKFSPDGKFLLKWGSEGDGDGQFHRPHGIAIDRSSGNVYVADSGNHRIQKFTSDGKFIKSWGDFEDPHDIRVDSAGNVYLVNTTYD